MKSSKSSKRLDLQGIRGLAILAVLGFHFYPDQFPNGYLGVDQFFVLSGFLMCMLLKRSENEAACTLISLFYSKRFKRILPLYLILIFISMIALYSFFPDTAIETNQESAMEALLFVSNRPKTDQEDYFQLLSAAVDIFTHTWSLSVEIQFYFLVPLLFLLGARFSGQKFQYAYYSIISLVSFIFFFISPDTVAFNSVFTRIWQFSIGMMVYLAGNQSRSTDSNRYQKLENQDVDEETGGEPPKDFQILNSMLQNEHRITYIILFVLILVTIYPTALYPELVRPVVTIGTGFLMLISMENRFLSNCLLTYIGDISYSLYLIHWPIYAYWKLTCDGDQKLLLLALISSIILAIICFETYEKWYLTLSSKNTAALCILLLSLNLLLINKDNVMNPVEDYGKDFKRLDGVNQNMTVDDAIKMNNWWSKNDMKSLYSSTCQYEEKGTQFGWCSHQNLSSTGKYKLAIIGNSVAANHADLIYQECGYKAKSILQGSVVTCEPLIITKTMKKWKCDQKLKDWQERIEKEKPDYAFIITRYYTISEPFPKNVTTFDQDPYYQMMKTQMLKFISNIKYKLYILDAIPRINPKVVREIASLLKNGTDPVDIDKRLVLPHEYLMARRRHAQLIKDCKGKCELIDYLPEFYNNATGTFRYFDEKGFSYWTFPEHFTPRGLEHLRHVWTDVCRKL